MSLPELHNYGAWKFQSAQTGGIRELLDFLSSNFAKSVTAASNFVYDGNGRLTEFRADGILYTIAYPNSTTINFGYSGILKQITLDGSGRVIGIATL